ncbi:MAG: hypothetical protein M3N14_11335 [Bacteroidota bacterium]|nr:hypothetical protein [Bacteroidota bacterium]
MEGTMIMDQSEKGKEKYIQELQTELASFKLQLSLCKSHVAAMRDHLQSIRLKRRSQSAQ